MKAKKISAPHTGGFTNGSGDSISSAAQLQPFLSELAECYRGRVFSRRLLLGSPFWCFYRYSTMVLLIPTQRLLVENLGYRGLGWTQLQWMFTGFHFGQFQPVAWLSLGINHVFWWTDPFGYHLTNLSVHIVNAVIFYYIAVALFVHWQRVDAYPGVKWFGLPAAVAALSFALHPLRVESVAWASTRGELIASMFFLLSLLIYLKAIAAAAGGVMSAPGDLSR